MLMSREHMMNKVREEMPEKRWQHTIGVMETAVELAGRFGADTVKAEMAAILHDYCKFWPTERQAEVIRGSGTGLDVLNYDKELWHAHAGAVIAPSHFGVEDEEVLDAIRYHTSGREGMTQLDKIVCLADYMEPGRDFPGVKEIRKLAKHSLEEALVAGFDTTITFLISKGKRIYPLTVLARNGLIQELKLLGG
jgi:predicted HD superfamily hydrolase involved in NAD metabolism